MLERSRLQHIDTDCPEKDCEQDGWDLFCRNGRSVIAMFKKFMEARLGFIGPKGFPR
jgi:hypothetical protein